MKTKPILLLTLTILSLGCAQHTSCEKTVFSLGLPEQMQEQGLAWANSMSIGETRLVECYSITRDTKYKWSAEVVC